MDIATILFTVQTGIRILIGHLAILLNLLTLVCVVKFSNLRTAANFLVASDALGDFFSGVMLGIILPITTYSTSWHLKHPFCLIGWFLLITGTMAQFLSLAILGLERRNSLLFQLNRSKKWSVKSVCSVIVMIWVTVGAYTTTITVMAADVPEGTICMVKTYFPWFHPVLVMGVYALALFVITFSYGHIGWIAFRSRNQVAHSSSSSNSSALSENQRNDMKVTKMMAMIVGVYISLYFPLLLLIVTRTPRSPVWHIVLQNIAIPMFEINFFINPFIYAWRNKAFFKAFKKMLATFKRLCPAGCGRCCCCRRCGPVVEQDATMGVGTVVINVNPTSQRTCPTMTTHVTNSTHRALTPRPAALSALTPGLSTPPAIFTLHPSPREKLGATLPPPTV